MALATNTLARPGADLLGGTKDALFLKKFAGEVLTTFETEAMFKELTTTRTIENGKSASFPAVGTAVTKYHTAGDSVIEGTGYLNNMVHTEKVITIEGLLTSSVLLANIDEAMNHFDVRSIYSTEIGRSLAKAFDKAVAQTIISAARLANNFGTNGPDGDSGTSDTWTAGNHSQAVTNSGTDGSVLAGAVLAGLRKLDERDVPSDSRYIAVRPAQYWLLIDALTKGDFKAPYTSNSGIFENGKVAMIGGATIVKSNNIPSTDLSGDTTIPEQAGASRRLNYANTQAIVFHPASTGCVKLLDVAVESEYQIERQATLMVAKYAVGHGVLRPEASYEVKSA
jgi:hypothetical protein